MFHQKYFLSLSSLFKAFQKLIILKQLRDSGLSLLFPFHSVFSLPFCKFPLNLLSFCKTEARFTIKTG